MSNHLLKNIGCTDPNINVKQFQEYKLFSFTVNLWHLVNQFCNYD